MLHGEIIELPLERQYTENEIEWIRQIHSQYSDISGQIESVSSNKETKTHAKESHNPLRMEKVRIPSFDGNIRSYPQFKGDSIEHVIPIISEVSAPYVLRSCLSKEPLECVKTVDDNLEEMWARLDDKYGDPTKVTDVIIDAIQNFKTIQKGETKKLPDFITVLEDGYRDLKRLGLEHEIMTSAVSTIEKKTSREIGPFKIKDVVKNVVLESATVLFSIAQHPELCT